MEYARDIRAEPEGHRFIVQQFLVFVLRYIHLSIKSVLQRMEILGIMQPKAPDKEGKCKVRGCKNNLL